MIREIKVPELGENIEKADVTSILVAEGDTVAAEQPIIEVESDKASVEVPAPSAGVIKELRIKAGQQIKVGQVILTLDTEDEEGGAETKKPESTDTAATKETSPPAQPGAKNQDSQPALRGTDAPPKVIGTPVGEDAGEPVPAAPSVRRLARELGVEIGRVTGSGPAGRINHDDVKSYVKSVVQRRVPQGATGAGMPGVPDLPDFAQFGSVRRESMSGIRRKTAEIMSLSWSNIPHVTQFDDADISDVEAWRKKIGKKMEKQGTKVTVTAIVLKVIALALKRFPQFNASIDIQRDEIIYKDYVHIGVAVDTDRGLIVPVIRDADQKGIVELATEMNDLATRAREKKTKPDELQGSNLSLTNLGGLGTTYFTPIIKWPDVAVLGIGRARTEAMFIDEDWVPRQIMPMSVSYDHRIIDGADAARFLRWIAETLEQPMGLLL